MRVSKNDIVEYFGLKKNVVIDNICGSSFKNVTVDSSSFDRLIREINYVHDKLDLLIKTLGYEYNVESTNPPCLKKILRGK